MKVKTFKFSINFKYLLTWIIVIINLENTQKTDWHRVVVFRPGLRDTVYNFLQKGQRVHVSGKIMYGELKDESGNIRTTTSIAADDIIFFNAQKI